jgi:isocitrate lyase
MGYKFQFITLAGFHTQNIAIFELAEKYKKEGMAAYSRIQQQEFSREKDGYTSVKHQREVGTHILMQFQILLAVVKAQPQQWQVQLNLNNFKQK